MLMASIVYCSMYDSTMQEEDAESQDDRESHIGKNCNTSDECFKTQSALADRAVKYRISHTALRELLHILGSVNLDLPKDNTTMPNVANVKELDGVIL